MHLLKKLLNSLKNSSMGIHPPPAPPRLPSPLQTLTNPLRL